MLALLCHPHKGASNRPRAITASAVFLCDQPATRGSPALNSFVNMDSAFVRPGAIEVHLPPKEI
jgi:hypothetical protein